MPKVATGRDSSLPTELTGFVGRRQEFAEIKRLLGESRLVTLTGIGGVGKTRLALRVAAGVQRAFSDGAWLVDLTQIPGGTSLAQQIESPDVLAYPVMAALGLRFGAGSPMRQLTDYLGSRRALLVLDNCEHLLPACAALVDGLLRACPELRILATSRQPLLIAGETIAAVRPLPTPATDQQANVASLVRNDSVALLMARAQAAAPEFTVTETNAAAVAELCRRLDGLPLAIELAAAWVRVLPPVVILERLVDRFPLLSRSCGDAPARHQTLRACVEWSFDLCSRSEQLLWARLPVFVGGFDLEAVEEVCADNALPTGDLLDVLAGLVDKSIVDRTDVGGDQARYRLLETIRAYGHERLNGVGELATLRRRHRDWYQQLAARATADRLTPRQTYWITRLTRDHPNVRAAVEFCLTEPDQAENALLLVTSLPRSYWWSQGVCGEGMGWLERGLAQAPAPTVLRVRAVLLAGFLAFWLGENDILVGRLEEGDRLAQRLHDAPGLALAAFIRGQVALVPGNNLAAVIESGEQGLAVLAALPQSQQQPELPLRLQLLLMVGVASAHAGDHDRAEQCLRETLETAEAHGATVVHAWALQGLGLAAWRQGKIREADQHVRECLQLVHATGLLDPYLAALGLTMLAWIAARLQRYWRAATLLGVVASVQRDIGKSLTADRMLVADHDTCEQQTRAALGDAAYDEAFRHGEALPLEDALADAIEEPRHGDLPPADDTQPLTPRERQIAELIAGGLSNKEIADKLVVSQRTVESHVQHILTKLRCANRAQIAVWTAERRSVSTRS